METDISTLASSLLKSILLFNRRRTSLSLLDRTKVNHWIRYLRNVHTSSQEDGHICSSHPSSLCICETILLIYRVFHHLIVKYSRKSSKSPTRKRKLLLSIVTTASKRSREIEGCSYHLNSESSTTH